MGRPSFLRAECRRQEQQWRMCQCPEWGDLHFYKAFHNAEGDTLATVSMPWKGRPSFLRGKVRLRAETAAVCQCPERGDLHFYPCLWKPLYIKALRVHFSRSLSEYSEKGIFEWCFLEVHNLFIFDSPIPSFSIPLFSGFEKYLQHTFNWLILIDSIKKSWVMISSHHLRYRMGI